jgi:adenylate kinase
MISTGFQVIYLTGPPATGKSSLTAALKQRVQLLEIFTYSQELAEFVNRKQSVSLTQDNLREQSAKVISPEDVERVDELLIDFVQTKRKESNIIIDSHAVTKESYGFRVTPFSIQKLSLLSPTMIFMLYTEPSVVRDRIERNSQGRPLISEFEASFHCELQADVALIYGISLGIPVYFLNSEAPIDDLVEQIYKRLRRVE